jgi:drug/metabolite transporter (DMT)-like permease
MVTRRMPGPDDASPDPQGKFAASEGSIARAIALIILSTVFFAVMHALVRHITQQIHPFEVAFFRNLFGLLVVVPFVVRYGFGILRTERLPLHSLRAVLNAAGMLLFFYGLSAAPLATVTALSFTAPIFVTVLAVLFLGEVVRIKRWTAIILGFTGALVVLRPTQATVGPGELATLASSMVWAGALLVIKILGRTEKSVTIITYMSLLMMPISLVAASFFWTWPTLEQLGVLIAIGILGSLGQLLMTQALKEGDASVVMPFDFFKLIWATLLGYLFFAEIPDLFTWIGGAMIFGSAVYIARRERSLGTKPAAPVPDTHG